MVVLLERMSAAEKETESVSVVRTESVAQVELPAADPEAHDHIPPTHPWSAREQWKRQRLCYVVPLHDYAARMPVIHFEYNQDILVYLNLLSHPEVVNAAV